MMISIRPIWLAGLTAVALLGDAPESAAHPGHDDAPHTHERYHLFRPTPPSAMRPLSTDRPDLTESPFTLDAGHFQIEMDVVSWSRDRSGTVRVDAVGVGVANLKLGLTGGSDLQVVVETWNRRRTENPGLPRETVTGFGDVTTRLKINLFGNDGGRAALAVMPFVGFATAKAGLGREDIEGGVIVPVAWDLPRGWGLGVMAEIDFGLGGNPDPVWISTATASHDIAGPLAGFVELAGEWPTATGEPVLGTFDVGLTLGIGRDLQLDAGAYLGLNEATEDVTLFLGVAARR